MSTCTVPPVGWYCTRSAGHEGPCAAWPDARITQESSDGGRTWQSAIPYPLIRLFHHECVCGRRCLTMRSYRKHWREAHENLTRSCPNCGAAPGVLCYERKRIPHVERMRRR